MKLYATTTSERASKGQGGKYLEISVSGKDEQVFHKVYVTLNKDNEPLIATYTTKGIKKVDFDTFEAFVSLVDYETKGKKQKGEASDYHIGARYIDCKKSNTDYCDKCGYTNR